MNYLLIGEYIRKIREIELKKSKEEFSEELGISLHTLKRLENAERKVCNIEIYEKISKLSGYTIDQIIDISDKVDGKTKLISKITNTLEDLSEIDLKEVYKIVDCCKNISKNKKKK